MTAVPMAAPTSDRNEGVIAAVSVLLLLGIVALLAVLSRSPELASLEPKDTAAADPRQHPHAHAAAAREEEIAKRFQEI
jgi:hypothetical protein